MKFQGDILNFCDFIQVFVFTTNHHLKAPVRTAADDSFASVYLQSVQGVHSLQSDFFTSHLFFQIQQYLKVINRYTLRGPAQSQSNF